MKDLSLYGSIIYNDMNTLLESELIPDDCFALKEDLLQVSYQGEFLIDVGWYPEFDLKGHFTVQAIQNENWEDPLIKAETKDIKILKFFLKKIDTALHQNEL